MQVPRIRRRSRRRSPRHHHALPFRFLPLGLSIAIFAGIARLRPFVSGVAAVVIGFTIGMAALVPFRGDEGGSLSSWASGFGLGLEGKSMAALPAPPAPPLPTELRTPREPGARSIPVDRVVRVQRGDTLMNLLTRQGVDHGEAYEVISVLEEVYDPRTLREGQAVTMTLLDGDGLGSGMRQLVGLQLAKSFDRYAGAARLANGAFGSFEIDKKLEIESARASGTIESSLFADAIRRGVPAGIMAEFIHLFSYDVDFQRDIQPGNGFDLLFERFVERGGQVAQDGDILYAELRLDGRAINLYRFEREDGSVNYFGPDGASIRRALLMTPVDGARISSGFGMRRHPIMGYSRMHRGIDFAAPTGTPIQAAGDGVVEYADWKGAYGKYIRIRHNETYSTAYAHMNRFASGLSRGNRVEQGDVIGYVGTTGRSTGPHLHYEVLKNGEQINPSELRFPSAEELAGRELKRFKEVRDTIDRQRRGLPDSMLLAENPVR